MDLTGYYLLLQSAQYQAIRTETRAGHNVHAYLLQGEQGAGKRSLAKLLAAALLCPQQEKPCLACNTCRRVLEGEHPDVHVFTSDKRSISVEQMRALAAESLSSSYEGGARVFIIQDADTMTVQAQNCLLKTLEEPDGSAVFVLLARSAELLLSTIRSRVRCVRLPGFSAQAVQKQLEALKIPDAAALSAACGGCIGRALQLAQGDPLTNKAVQMQQYIRQKNAGRILLLLNESKDDAPRLLQLVEAQLALELEQQAQSNTLLKQLMAVSDAQKRLSGNISFTLTADRLAAELCKA